MEPTMQESTAKSPGSNRTRHGRETEENSQKRDLEDAVAEIEQRRQEKFSSANLDADHSRRMLAASHPMLEQCYFIETDGTNAFYEIVCDHAIARKSGLYITGEFRVGKTTSIENTMFRLKEDMPWLAVLYHSAKRQHGLNRPAFCR